MIEKLTTSTHIRLFDRSLHIKKNTLRPRDFAGLLFTQIWVYVSTRIDTYTLCALNKERKRKFWLRQFYKQSIEFHELCFNYLDILPVFSTKLAEVGAGGEEENSKWRGLRNTVRAARNLFGSSQMQVSAFNTNVSS